MEAMVGLDYWWNWNCVAKGDGSTVLQTVAKVVSNSSTTTVRNCPHWFSATQLSARQHYRIAVVVIPLLSTYLEATAAAASLFFFHRDTNGQPLGTLRCCWLWHTPIINHMMPNCRSSHSTLDSCSFLPFYGQLCSNLPHVHRPAKFHENMIVGWSQTCR